MLAVGSASELEFCARAAGVEVLLTLAERAPAIMRKCHSLALGLFPLAISLACEVRSSVSWFTQAPSNEFAVPLTSLLLRHMYTELILK